MGEEGKLPFLPLEQCQHFQKLLSAGSQGNGAQVLGNSRPSTRCQVLWRICPEAIGSVISSSPDRSFGVFPGQECMDLLTYLSVILSPSAIMWVSCRCRNARASAQFHCASRHWQLAFFLWLKPSPTLLGIWAQCVRPCKVNMSTQNFYFPKSLL